MKKMLATASLLLCGLAQSASAAVFTVQSYTANSLTFSISGQMPAVNPGTLLDGPNEIDIRYTGNLFSGPQNWYANSLSANPINGSGGLVFGNTGGFGLTENYSWLYFGNALTGLTGSGSSVTLTWAGGSNMLNTSGTGNIELYWGNLSQGVDQAGARNELIGGVSVVRGIVGTPAQDVPEPGAAALFGLGLLALGAMRRRARK